jgi:glutamate racemase
MEASQPIGVFDSGIGGLTVARAILDLMPNEHLIYFGDTAHLPYGDKSEAAIQAYSVKIADLLEKKGCKVIVIACNSASSAAYELLKIYVKKDVKIINVIDPMVEMLARDFKNKKVGLIGTKRTVTSNVYKNKINEMESSIELKSLATPLLVPMIEEGFFNHAISHEIITQYLDDASIKEIDALVLGCTHYPLIKKEIEQYYHEKNEPDIKVLDSSLAIADALYYYLRTKALLSDKKLHEDEFMVSDYTSSFEKSTELFFNRKVRLTRHQLWD